MNITEQQYINCLTSAIRFNPLDSKNRAIRRAVYYIKIKYYKQKVTERYPLDKLRAEHYGLKEGTYRTYAIYVMPDSERAKHLCKLRQLYKQVTDQ